MDSWTFRAANSLSHFLHANHITPQRALQYIPFGTTLVRTLTKKGYEEQRRSLYEFKKLTERPD